MDRHNIELGALSPEQWDSMARVAQDLTPVDGYSWQPDNCNEIGLYIRPDDAPGAWQDWVSRSGYGSSERRVATFIWNDGDPFARIEADPLPNAPARLPQETEAMARELEQWVHERWQDLRTAAGMPYLE